MQNIQSIKLAWQQIWFAHYKLISACDFGAVIIASCFPFQITVLARFLRGNDPMKTPHVLTMTVTGDVYIAVWLKCQLDRYAAAAGVVYSRAARWL